MYFTSGMIRELKLPSLTLLVWCARYQSTYVKGSLENSEVFKDDICDRFRNEPTMDMVEALIKQEKQEQ